MIRERWEEGEDHSKGVLQQIVEMRNSLQLAWKMAKENLGQAQVRQKGSYNKKVRPRSFEPQQKVLVLLPTDTSKFLAKWHGPYTVLRRLNEVDYEVETPDRKKENTSISRKLIERMGRPRGVVRLRSR